jgi:hypothetical protein
MQYFSASNPAKNLLNESIYFDYAPPPTFAGHINRHPFRVVITSSNNNPHIINLSSKYSKSYDVQNNINKWSFLRPENRFLDLSGNQIFTIQSIDTDLYMGSDGNMNTISGTFIGVSGYADFYFVDDIYNYDIAINNQKYTTLIAVLEVSGVNFFDEKQSNHVMSSRYANSMVIAYQPHIFHYRDPDYIKISENGIRDFINPRWVPVEQNIIFTFNWNEKYNQLYYDGNEIKPINLNKNFNKSIPSNTNKNTINISVTSNEIKAYFKNYPYPEEVTYSNKDNYLSPGYSKTIFNVITGTNNPLILSAISTFESPNVTGNLYSPKMWLSNPNSGLVQIVEYNFPKTFSVFGDENNDTGLDLRFLQKAQIYNFKVPIVTVAPFDKDSFATTGFHGINSIAALPPPAYQAWAIDGELNYLYKFGTRGDILSAIDLLSILPDNLILAVRNQASPTSIVLDGYQNLWITLYDSRYVINLDSNGNYIGALDLAQAVPYPQTPSIDQEWYDANQPVPDESDAQNLVEPTILDVDSKNNIWVTYSNYSNGYLIKYDERYYIKQVISYPPKSCPQDIIIDNEDNVWVALSNNIWNSIGGIEKRDTNGNLLSSYGNIMGVNELALDLNQNLWFTYSYSRLGKINNLTTEVKTFNVLNYATDTPKYARKELTIPNINTDETALEGITCDLKGYLYVINSVENQIYVWDTNNDSFIDKFFVTPQGYYFWNPELNGKTLIEFNSWTKSLQAHGDWMGTRWLNKYNKIKDTYQLTLTGQSSPLKFLEVYSKTVKLDYSYLASTFYKYIETDKFEKILVPPSVLGKPENEYWNLDIFKINENYDLSAQMRLYALTPTLQESLFLFEKFLPSIYGTYPFSHQDLGLLSYEKISNFVLNHSDIDTCEIDKLYSLSDATNTNTSDYQLNYPPDIKKLMDILSINQSILWGSVPKNQNNFDSSYNEEKSNKGSLLTSNYMVTAGTPVILKTKSLNSYELVQTGPVGKFYISPQINKIENSLENFNRIILDKNDTPATEPKGDISDLSCEIASQNILKYKSDLQLQIVEYIKYNYPETLNTNSLSAKCYRDTGYIIDALAADIANNTNHRSIDVGDMYFKGTLMGKLSNPNSNVPTIPQDQVEATIAAINALSFYINGTDIPTQPIPFTTFGILSSEELGSIKTANVLSNISNITYPLQNGGLLNEYNPKGVATEDDINLGYYLLNNKKAVQSEIAKYVLKKEYIEIKNNFILEEELRLKCNRDVGLMIDAVANDLITGVTSKSIQYALAYWEGSTSRLPEKIIPNQKLRTIDTINKLKSVLVDLYIEKSTNITDNADIKYYTSYQPAKIENSLNNFNKIILDKNKTPSTSPSGEMLDNSYIIASQNILKYKSELQLQVVKYAKYNYPLALNNDSLSAKCFRDTGYIIDAIAADIANNTNHRSIDVGDIYFKGTLMGPPNTNSNVPTLPQNQIEATIESIKSLIYYINGDDIPSLPSSFTNSGILSSYETGNQRKTDIANRISDVVFPLQNNGTLRSYSPILLPDQQDINLANEILNKKTTIQDEVASYVLSKGYLLVPPQPDPTLSAICKRDVGLMVDALVNDLKTGVIARTIQYALAYWEGSTTRLPESLVYNHKLKTIDTIERLINHIIDICKDNLVNFTWEQSQLIKNSLENFNKIIISLSNVPRTTPVGDIADDSYQNASNNILKYKTQLQKQVVDYANYFYPVAMSNNPTLTSKCFRDTGYIIDALAADIANNANHRSIEVGNMYFKGVLKTLKYGNNNDVPVIPQSQIEATVASINSLIYYINGDNIPTEIPSFTSSGILSSTELGSDRKFDVIFNILNVYYPLQNNGLLPSYQPSNSVTQDISDLGDFILNNRFNIQDVISQYVADQGYLVVDSYNASEVLTAKCKRDVGLMVDAIANDLSSGVTSKSIQYALAYWEGSTNRLPENVILNQKYKTIDTINMLKKVLISIYSNRLTKLSINSQLSSVDKYTYPIRDLVNFMGINNNGGAWEGYYEFYEYIPTISLKHNDNVIDWDNPQTTIIKNITNIFDWVGDEQYIDTLFSYKLHKGLGII